MQPFKGCFPTFFLFFFSLIKLKSVTEIAESAESTAVVMRLSAGGSLCAYSCGNHKHLKQVQREIKANSMR